MATLRVLSWNVRTLGTHALSVPEAERLAAFIRRSRADVVCIQELMAGSVRGPIGTPISTQSVDTIELLRTRLNRGDPPARWAYGVTGINGDMARSLRRPKRRKPSRDAYAFLWKQRPDASKHGHGDPVDAVTLTTAPTIANAKGFPGRRPGFIGLRVTTAMDDSFVNVFSYHAQTPPNSFWPRKNPTSGAGTAMNKLFSLAGIGGGTISTAQRRWAPNVKALPDIDTLVVGDFNYSIDKPEASLAYRNLTTNYRQGIGTWAAPENTTYSSSSKKTWRLVSSYDNVFSLADHGTFVAHLQPGGYDVINFIAEGVFSSGHLVGFETFDDRWKEIWKDRYKRQHAVTGISDHLPVWQDFHVVPPPRGARTRRGGGPIPTAAAYGNSLFHAWFGAESNGLVVDPDAAEHRRAFVGWIERLAATPEPPPADGELLLRALLDFYDDDPSIGTRLRQALELGWAPSATSTFVAAFPGYLRSLRDDRSLSLSEAGLLASWQDRAAQVHIAWSTNGGPVIVFNAGRPSPNHLYFNAPSWARWAQ